MLSINTRPADAGFRDLRVDFFRGICLLLIYIDHIPHNKLASFTFQRFAFIDCADVFVFISGYVSGLSYTKTLIRDGVAACFRKAWWRCGQIFLAHNLVSWAVLAVLYAFLLGDVVLPSRFMSSFLEHPFRVFIDILLLQLHDMIYVLDILPMYVIFIALAPLLAMGLRRHKGVLLLSIGLYLAAQHFSNHNFHSHPSDGPFYWNVLAWQLVFALGFVLGNRGARGLPPTVRLPRSYLILSIIGLLTITVVQVGANSPLLAKIIHTRFLLDTLPSHVPLTGKSAVEPLRVVNLLLMAMVFGSVSLQHPAWSWPMFRPVIVCGQNSLVAFSLGLVLSTVASCLVLRFGTGWLPALLSIVGCLALLATGYAARRMKEQAWRAQSRDRGRETRLRPLSIPEPSSGFALPAAPHHFFVKSSRGNVRWARGNLREESVAPGKRSGSI
jgi:hypothetical protein